MDYVKKIAYPDINIRKDAIIDILRKNELPYLLQRTKQNEIWIENIIIPVNSNGSSKRLVLGAHYDSVAGSCGANDNAASVSILIHAAKKLLGKANRPIDIVFFDKEESPDKGSETYIRFIGKERISAMVNLDACGVGDYIAVNHKGNLENVLFYGLMDSKVLNVNNVKFVKNLPKSDDSSFDMFGIPNISVSVLTSSDIKFFNMFTELPEKYPQSVRELYTRLDVMKTLHNSEFDTVDIVSQQSIDMVCKYIITGLLHKRTFIKNSKSSINAFRLLKEYFYSSDSELNIK